MDIKAISTVVNLISREFPSICVLSVDQSPGMMDLQQPQLRTLVTFDPTLPSHHAPTKGCGLCIKTLSTPHSEANALVNSCHATNNWPHTQTIHPGVGSCLQSCNAHQLTEVR